jgi:hypothetical protein
VQGTEPTTSCTDAAAVPTLSGDSASRARAKADSTNPFKIPPQ